MSEREELAKVIAEADGSGHFLRNGRQYAYGPLADAVLAAGYRKPRQVTTVEELDALPNGTILISSGRYPRYKWTLWRVKTGGMIEQVGHELKGVTPFRYFVDPLPATVLHVGTTND